MARAGNIIDVQLDDTRWKHPATAYSLSKAMWPTALLTDLQRRLAGAAVVATVAAARTAGVSGDNPAAAGVPADDHAPAGVPVGDLVSADAAASVHAAAHAHAETDAENEPAADVVGAVVAAGTGAGKVAAAETL